MGTRSAWLNRSSQILPTRAEIEALTDSDELVSIVKRKLCELIVSGTVWP